MSERETAAKALIEYVVANGPLHEDECPCDDTCRCVFNPVNAGVNLACRLLASLPPDAAPQTCEWREIATAPKDGTRVLLWVVPTNLATPFAWDGERWMGDDYPLNMAWATHWMPLPSPPVVLTPAEEPK